MISSQKQSITPDLPPNTSHTVSVVIPCYNQANFLAEAIESVLNQSIGAAQIIVVDDGSLDETAAVAAKYADVGYVYQENQGLSGARNTGLQNSDGQFLIFLDADDRLLPHAIRSGIACLDANPECVFAVGRFRNFSHSEEPLPTQSRPEIYGEPYLALLQGNIIAMHGTVIYRREVFKRVGTFDRSLPACEDYDLYLRITREYPVAFHDTVIAEYRKHDHNMSHNASLMLETRYRVLHAQLPFIKDKPRHLTAYRIGMLTGQNAFGPQLTKEIRSHFQHFELLQATIGCRLLWRYAPSVFIDTILHLAAGACQRLFPPAAKLLRRVETVRKIGRSDRLQPAGYSFGSERGTPIDRYYIENFMCAYANDIRGHVLEIGDSRYVRRFGGEKVSHVDVLHVSEGNEQATIVADLTQADDIPSNTFDCVILAQTLHLIYDYERALKTVHRSLKPNGVVLATVPGISQISDDEWAESWYWSFTTHSVERAFHRVFDPSQVTIRSFGNVSAATSFLYGMTLEEVNPDHLDFLDTHYQVIVAIRAQKDGRC